jgi:hypothetical protein
MKRERKGKETIKAKEKKESHILGQFGLLGPLPSRLLRGPFSPLHARVRDPTCYHPAHTWTHHRDAVRWVPYVG